MNKIVKGIIYHVVDKTTKQVIKVGSTIRTLDQRFKQADYKKNYINHFLIEAKTIESSDLDWYDPKDSDCPFLWHLIASEHIEIVKMGTYRSSPLSNFFSPIDQKYFSKFGLSELSSLGGKKGGRRNVESGHLKSISSKGGLASGFSNGRKNGLILAREKRGVCAPGTAVKGGKAGGPKAGRIAVESGQLESLRTFEHQSQAGKVANHNRWHVKRNIINPNCKLCKDNNARHAQTSLGDGSPRPVETQTRHQDNARNNQETAC
jgi:hypothetical protein